MPAEITPSELRAMARTHALIVGPGELLVVTVPPHWPPWQVRELNDALMAACFDYARGAGIRVLAVPGTAVGVGKLPEGSDAAEIEKMLSPWHDPARGIASATGSPSPGTAGSGG
jgi:hypothetical protein